MMMIELFESFPPQFSEDPLQILKKKNFLERYEVGSARRKVGCVEIVPGLRWLHWEVCSEKSNIQRPSNVLQLSEINSDQLSISCKVCLHLGDTDTVSIFAEGQHGSNSTGVKLLQTKICIVTSDNKVHNVTLEVEDTSMTFLSPLLTLSDENAILDVNKLNRRFVSTTAGVHSSVSWYWAKLQMVPRGRTLSCAAWLSSSRLLLGLSEGDLISVVIIGESCALQEFYIKDARSGVQSLWTLLSGGVGGRAPNSAAITTDKPSDILAVSVARDPTLPAGVYLALSVNRLGQLRMEAVQYTQDGDISSATAGHCQHSCVLQADLTDLASAAHCSLFEHLDAHSYKLGKSVQAFQLGKDRLLSGGILRSTLQWMDQRNYELTLAMAVEMNEFAEDESLLLFGEISSRKVWQILVASCTLQWSPSGGAAIVRDSLRLRTAPFRLPSNPAAGLLDMQMIVGADGSSLSVFSAWKTHDGSGSGSSGGDNNELVISKWVLPSASDGFITEWRSSERRLRRLQDDVIAQQLKDFLRSAEQRSFIDKEDTIKAEMLRRIFLPHRFLDITILQTCHQMVRSIDRLQQSKRQDGAKGGLHESKFSDRPRAEIRWNSSLIRAISGLPHENVNVIDSATVTKEDILEELAEAVTEACECLASLQVEDASAMGHLSDGGGYLDCLVSSFLYALQLCEGAQSDTDGLGNGSFIVSPSSGQSFIQGAIAKSDRRISFLLEGDNESDVFPAVDAALSLLEGTIEPRSLKRVADSSLQSLLTVLSTGSKKVDVIPSVGEIIKEGFGGKLDLIIPRLQEIILTSTQDNPIRNFISALTRDLNTEIQDATIHVNIPPPHSAPSVPRSNSLRNQVVTKLCIQKIEQSLHRTQLGLILLIALVHSQDSAHFFAAERGGGGASSRMKSYVEVSVIPQMILKLLQLSFFAHASTVRLAIPVDSSLDDSFPLSFVLRTHSTNGFEVYDTDLSVLDNFILSDGDLLSVQSASQCVDKLLELSSMNSLTRYLLHSGQYSLLKVWMFLMRRQVDLASSFLPTIDELEIQPPRLDLSQQVNMTLANESTMLSGATLSAFVAIIRQHIQTVSSMAGIHELQQELSSSSNSSLYNQSGNTSDSIVQLKNDLLQMLPPLPTDAAEVEYLQFQFEQLMDALKNGTRAAISPTTASLDHSHTAIVITWCDDDKRMNVLKNTIVDSFALVVDSLNAAAHKPATAVVMQHFLATGSRSSFVQFYPNFIAGLPVFTLLLRIYLVEDLTVAVEMLPHAEASDDLAIELYCYLEDTIKFAVDLSVYHTQEQEQEQEVFARAVQAVTDYADGNAQDLSTVFLGYLTLELLKAMYSLFECLLRRGGHFARALEVLSRISDIEKSIGKVRIPSTAASSAHFGKVERCLRALVDSAVDNGQLEWLCKLAQPKQGQGQGQGQGTENTEFFLEIIEDQLQLLANRCDVVVFLPQKPLEKKSSMSSPTNYCEYYFVFLLRRRKFRAASRTVFSFYEQLSADTEVDSLVSTAATAAIGKSLLVTSIHALGLLPQDQAFIHIQNVQNSTVGQRMDDGTTMGAKEVMVVDAPTLSFLFSLSSAVDAVVHLHSKRLLEENLNQSELLHKIRSESVCENMVVILSRAGRVNLAVSLARHATHLVKVADSGNVDRFLKGRGIAFSRLGSLSLYEVAVLSSVRTLNFLSLQLQDRGCLNYDMETVVSDLSTYGTILPESSIDSYKSDLRSYSHYFEAFSWRQMLRWCRVRKSDRLFCLSLACVLQLESTQPIPAYVIDHFKEESPDTIHAVLALFTRYHRLTEACKVAVQVVELSQSGSGQKGLWLSLGVLDSLIEVTEKEVQMRGQLGDRDELMAQSLKELKDSILAYMKELVTREI